MLDIGSHLRLLSSSKMKADVALVKNIKITGCSMIYGKESPFGILDFGIA